jgi:nucleotide-binding universal stress UspA family protein
MSTILVPLDGSDFAEHALSLALDIARRGGRRLELVTVHEASPPMPSMPGVPGTSPHDFTGDARRDTENRARLRLYLDATRDRLSATHRDVAITGTMLVGPPPEMLARYVRDTAPALVVMTTHGRGGVSRMWLGSVTEGLVRRVTVPVLAVRPPADAEGRVATSSAQREIRRVLVAVDGSPESEAAIAPTAALLGTSGVEYTLLRVVPPLHPVVRAVATDWEYSRDLGQEQRVARHYLQDLVAHRLPAALRADVLTRCDVPPAVAIAAVAAEIGADVVALATHGRGPVGRFVYGSVADKVLRTAPAAVLLHHTPRAAPQPETVAPFREADADTPSTAPV